MTCCTLITLLLAAITVGLILSIPMTPSAEELQRIQKRKENLKLKAGVYRHR